MRKTAAAVATVAVTGFAFAQERQSGQEQEPAAGQQEPAAGQQEPAAGQMERGQPSQRATGKEGAAAQAQAKSARGKAEKWAETRRSAAMKDQQPGKIRAGPR